MNQEAQTIISLLTEIEQARGIKARRELGTRITCLARGMEKKCAEAVAKFIRLENEVKPEFCKKCSRRSFQDVINERFEHRQIGLSNDEIITRIERKDAMVLLLLARKHCKTCFFHSDLLPLDLFKHILALSGVCEVIMWRERMERSFPRDIQFLLEQDPEYKDLQFAENVVLKGSFRLQGLDHDTHGMPFHVEHFVKTDTLKPVYTQHGMWISIRWDDAENLEWWCEFRLTSNAATLKGRIPRDTKCLGFTNYKDRDLRWTFGSEKDPTFWADVFIYN